MGKNLALIALAVALLAACATLPPTIEDASPPREDKAPESSPSPGNMAPTLPPLPETTAPAPVEDDRDWKDLTEDMPPDVALVFHRSGGFAGIEGGVYPVGAGILIGKPNPFSGSTVITCYLPQGAAETGDILSLSVYDLGGRLVRTLAETEMAASQIPVSASWDGRDWQGRVIPSGTYIAELEIGEFRRTGKLMILR